MAENKSWIANAYDQIKGTIKKFGAENGSMVAAAISFYATLSLLPLLLLGVSVLGYIVGNSDKAFNTVVGFFNSFMPTSTFVTDTLRGLVRARGVIGIVGIVSLLWTGSQFFVTLQTALDDIWEVGQKPGYIKSRIKGIVMVLVFGIFLALSVGSTALVNVLQHPRITGFGSSVVTGLLSALAVVVAVVVSIAMFFVIYKWIPDTKVNWKSALYGAVFAGIAFEIAKELYRLYLSHFANYNKLYGSLGSVVILILWIYYSSMIMVMGAELGYVNEHGAKEEPEEAERMKKAS